MESLVRDEAGEALHLLADLTTATDESLRNKALRLAGRIMLDVARDGTARRPGAASLRPTPADGGGDLDIDLSIDQISAARAEGRVVGLDELVARDWRRPDLALCLVVDASGSMSGDRLAAASMAAAACAWRAPAEFAVLSFDRSVRVHRALRAQSPPVEVITGLLSLRGHGVTALGTALSCAGDQLRTARAGRRVAVLLSDCRATDDVDPTHAALALDELVILAPAADCAEATELAQRVGARISTLASAADAPRALAAVLDR